MFYNWVVIRSETYEKQDKQLFDDTGKEKGS